MPCFEFFCETCGITWEEILRVKDRSRVKCVCGAVPKKLVSVPARPVVYGYYSENLGATVTGPEQKKRLLRERNLVER